jgi:proteasome lid subunit RPN8/RPN11
MVVSTSSGTVRFHLEMRTTEGPFVHQASLNMADFNRAIEATFFDALREGVYDEYQIPASPRIEPHLPRESPESAGFEVIFDTPVGQRRKRFGIDYFKTLARQTGAKLAIEGKIAPDAQLTVQLIASVQEPTLGKRKLGIHMEQQTPSITIETGSRAVLGMCEQRDGGMGRDYPVYIPRHVLQESVSEARAYTDREIGGVLLGHLKRDEGDGTLFLQVSCLVPCEQTTADGVSVTFTHATWNRVREVLQWRGEGELIVGWMHSHPFRLCAECVLPLAPQCKNKILFYSSDDEFLMELTFARPFMIGLLAGIDPKLEAGMGQEPVKLFGWRDGIIVPRGYEVIEQ